TDERCSTTTGTCVTGACLPDRFTPNQSADTAALLAPGTYTALTLCDGGSDYYALNLNSGDRVQVVSDTDPLGSFDLQLYTPLGALLAEAPTALLATAGTTGKYVLVAATHDASALYALRIDVRAGTACQHSPPDVHPQPNLALALGDGRHLDYAVCPGEETWFVARTPGGVSFDAALDPTQGGPIVLELYDSNTTTLLARDASGAAALHVEAASSLGGEFFLRVVGASKVTSNRYDLTLRWLGALP
ncbi:MAG: hypothetical protein JST92_14165, partial [Deltaproteobacteria bacterium]|nr:hypothetical protein [Deltaproteobacteria bacterium]